MNFKRNAWVFGLAGLFLVLAVGQDLLTEGLLCFSSRQTTAIIVKAPLDHNTCKYSFTIGGAVFSGRGHECGNYPSGASFRIYYWPANPKITSDIISGTRLGGNVLFALGVLFVALIIAYFGPPEE